MPGMPEHGPLGIQFGDNCVEALGLLGDVPPRAFDALTKLALKQFDVPVALISIVQEHKDRQFFASQQGLASPWAERRETPLSHSFCKHVKQQNAPLIVTNAPKDPIVRDNLAITDLNVIAYLGVPICSPDGKAIGALCVIDDKERDWTPEEVALLGDLAGCVNDEVLLRASLKANADALERRRRDTSFREAISLAFMTPDLSVEERFQQLLRAGCRALGMDTGFITKIDGETVEILFRHGAFARSDGALDQRRTGNLTELVTSGQEQIVFHDVQQSNARGRHDLTGGAPGAYAGAPLILDGILFGTIELVGTCPRQSPWTEDEMTLLSIISMFATAHLGIFGQISALKRSETSLLNAFLHAKHGEAVA